MTLFCFKMTKEKNGKASGSKHTKHINIQCFFIKDLVDNGEMKIECCPTNEMVADFFGELSQGAKFIEFRNFILGVK